MIFLRELFISESAHEPFTVGIYRQTAINELPMCFQANREKFIWVGKTSQIQAADPLTPLHTLWST
jgi:hypothetical protein